MDGMGQRLRELRGDRRQAEIAKALGIGNSSYTMYENDQREPNYTLLCKIAEFYGVSTDFLLGRTECKSPDVEVQAICAKTGLDEPSVSSIINLEKNERFSSYTDSIDCAPEKVRDFICKMLGTEGIGCFIDFAIAIIQDTEFTASQDERLKSWIKLWHSNIDLPEEWRPYIFDPVRISVYSSAVMETEARHFSECMQKLLIYGTLMTEEDKKREEKILAEWKAEWEENWGKVNQDG